VISRCLLPFATTFARNPEAARQAWKELPDTCPHTDCSQNARCKDVCSEWAKGQAKPEAARA